MSNLRQNMTDEEWNSSSLPKVHYTRTEVKQLIYQFAKDAMVLETPDDEDWIQNWIENKLEL
jgi:hypothetical protein